VVRVQPVQDARDGCLGCILLKVVQDGLDNGRVFDAGDDLTVPPQCSQVSISKSKTRFKRLAQVMVA
jgi:hypothetical protein